MIVTGMAMAQNIHWFVPMLWISDVLIPKSDDMKDKRRKMTVMTVRRMMGASCRSLFASMRLSFWEFGSGKQLILNVGTAGGPKH